MPLANPHGGGPAFHRTTWDTRRTMLQIHTEGLPIFAQAAASDYGSLDELRIERWSRLKREVLALYGDMKGRIPDEAYQDLRPQAWEDERPDLLNVRPRCSDLHVEGLLRETGVKRRARRKMARELVITERGLEVLRRLNAKSDAAA